jgi:hypothetical protein
MAKQGEGAAVRAAFDGPTVGHDELLGQIEARIREEYARSSDASESGAKTSDFLDETGLNSQVFAWSKSIIKKLAKKDGQAKAMDMIRSWEVVLPMLKAHVAGQPDLFDQAASDLAPVEPATLADVAHLTGDDGHPDPDLDEDLGDAESDDDDPDFEDIETGPFDDDLDEDAADFADAVADLEPAQGNVVAAFRR